MHEAVGRNTLPHGKIDTHYFINLGYIRLASSVTPLTFLSSLVEMSTTALHMLGPSW